MKINLNDRIISLNSAIIGLSMFSKLFKKDKSTAVSVQKIVIDAKAFKPLLKEKFSPTLRKYGFKGTGFKYQRKTGRYIYFLDVQPSRYGGKCYVNLGVTIENFPTGIKNEYNPLASHFHKRLTPDDHSDGWAYGNTIEKAKQSVESMTDSFVKYGIPFYEQFKDFPHPLTKITLKDLEENSNFIQQLHPFASLYILLARYYISTGNKKKGIEFAKAGYARIDKTKRDKIEYIKNPETGGIMVLSKTPYDLINFYEKLIRGELA